MKIQKPETPRIEKVRLAMMIFNHIKTKPKTIEEIIATLEDIITDLKIN